MSRDRIAILGGGMLGVCTALELARRGRAVTLIEGGPAVMQGAGRWNEGKIHLGFMYAADPTLNTAFRILPGGLAFGELVERLLGQSIEGFTTEGDDIYLVHRDSVVDVSAFTAYADRTASLVRSAASAQGAPRYLADVRAATARALSRSELAAATTSERVLCGFRIPERSVSTVAIADLLCAALRDEDLIETLLDSPVTGVRRRDDGRFDILTNGANGGDVTGFDVVVNALWEGRPAVDATIGIVPSAPWSHRYRASLFGHAPHAALQSAVLCTGPFGDIKRYADGRVYLSWYPSGLLAEGNALEPPREAAALTPARRAAVKQGTLDGLSGFFPALRTLPDADALEVQGGWVYALGQGSLADRASTLHQRDRFEVTVDRGYISVDTAKYSLAPSLAAQVAEIVTGA